MSRRNGNSGPTANILVVHQILLRERQGLHDRARLRHVIRIQQENSSSAVFPRVPVANFPIKIELDRRAYLSRHDGHDLLACYAGLGFQQRKDSCGRRNGRLRSGVRLVDHQESSVQDVCPRRHTAASRERLSAIMSMGYEAELHSPAGRPRRRGGVPQRCPAPQFSQSGGRARRDAIGDQPGGARARDARRRSALHTNHPKRGPERSRRTISLARQAGLRGARRRQPGRA